MGIDSPREILAKSAADLVKLLRINQIQAEDILNAASSDAYNWRQREKTGSTSLTVKKEDDETLLPSSLTTDDAILDKVLNPGIPLGTLTEVVGERYQFYFLKSFCILNMKRIVLLEKHNLFFNSV